MTTLSLIIPVFNEEQAIPVFMDRIAQVRADIVSALGDEGTLEFVFVNDGSRDGTQAVLQELSEKNRDVRVINLSRNFGKEAALSAGLHYAGGHAVIPLDVDLQDPPEIIAAMVEKWKGGAHVVNAKRASRQSDTVFKRHSANAFYSFMQRISDQPVHPHVGDFRLIDRQAVNVLNTLSESSRFNKGLFSWIGFRTDEVEFVRAERTHGKTKWGVLGLWSLALDGITSSTTLPLRIWSYIGAGIAFLAFLYAVALIAYTLITGGDTPGYASIMVVVLMLGGLNLLSLGLMGEYLGRVAIEVRRRPLYIVESTKGFERGR